MKEKERYVEAIRAYWAGNKLFYFQECEALRLEMGEEEYEKMRDQYDNECYVYEDRMASYRENEDYA